MKMPRSPRRYASNCIRRCLPRTMYSERRSVYWPGRPAWASLLLDEIEMVHRATVPSAGAEHRASGCPGQGGRRVDLGIDDGVHLRQRAARLRMSRAMRQPSPPRTSGSNSMRRPARRSDFSRRSAGAAFWCFFITSGNDRGWLFLIF